MAKRRQLDLEVPQGLEELQGELLPKDTPVPKGNLGSYKDIQDTKIAELGTTRAVAYLALNKLSTNEIAERVGISNTLVRSYMEKIAEMWKADLLDDIGQLMTREAVSLDYDETRIRNIFDGMLHEAEHDNRTDEKSIRSIGVLADKIMSIQRRRASLLGLDRPVKHQLTINQVDNLAEQIVDAICKVVPDDTTRLALADEVMKVINATEDEVIK